MAIACLIIRELDKLASKKGVKIYLLAQYGKERNSPEVGKSKRVIECANPKNLTVIDLHEPLLEIKKRDRQDYKLLFTEGKRHHMTYQGNRFVAMEIKKAMLTGSGIK